MSKDDGRLFREASFDELVAVIHADWGPGMDDYAAGYLRGFDTLEDKAGNEAEWQMAYFLANAKRWCGPTARSVKAELRRRLGVPR